MAISPLLVGRLGGRKRLYHDLEELQGVSSVKKWLEGLREGPHRKTALYNFARYIRWRKSRDLEADPDMLVEDCLSGTNRTLISHLDSLVQSCQGETFDGSTLETRKKNFKDVVSFYRAHYITLPRAKVKAVDSGHKLSVEVTASKFLQFSRAVLLKARLTEKARAVILTMLQSRMDASTTMSVFNFYGYPQLVNHFGTEDFEKWETQRCPVRIDLVGPKNEYRYYTFLDVDAVEALRDWLRRRTLMMGGPLALHKPDGPSEMQKSDPVVITRDRRPMRAAYAGVIFREAGKKAGVNVEPGKRADDFEWASNRYPFHSHEVRDTLVTLARRVKADVVTANFFVGHTIDKLRYDKSPWDAEEYFRAEYLKIARPHLNVLTNFQNLLSHVRNMEERIIQLEEMVKGLLQQRSLSERPAETGFSQDQNGGPRHTRFQGSHRSRFCTYQNRICVCRA
jgi:hypothetical protein